MKCRLCGAAFGVWYNKSLVDHWRSNHSLVLDFVTTSHFHSGRVRETKVLKDAAFEDRRAELGRTVAALLDKCFPSNQRRTVTIAKPSLDS